MNHHEITLIMMLLLTGDDDENMSIIYQVSMDCLSTWAFKISKPGGDYMYHVL
jgi:hypothetical protein